MCLSPDGPQHFHLLTHAHSACTAAIDHFSCARLGAKHGECKEGEWGGASHPAPMAPCEPSRLQQKLRASGFGGVGICQGWGKEGLSCSIFRISALCPMGVNFPEQVRSTRRSLYVWCAASLTRPTAVMSFLKSFSLQGDFLCLSWEGVVSLDCGALRGFRDKVRGSMNPIYTVTSTIGSYFSDL